MPATSIKQQQAMGIARGIQKGEIEPKKGTTSAKIAKTMKPGDVKDFASTEHEGLPKKAKKESIDGAIDTLYMVKKPYSGCQLTDLVEPIDPLVGIGAGHEIVPDQVHAVFADQDQAQSIADGLYEEHSQRMEALEEKKGAVTGKISTAIDALEKKRKEHVDMAKAEPKNAGQHKEHIAKLAMKIDDLMSKLEKVEKSKKPTEDKKEKTVVKESINEADEPGSPERLMLAIKNPLIALVNAAKSTVEKSGEEPYASNKETDNAVDNLALLINLCYLFLPDKSKNLETIRSIKLSLAKAADQKFGTDPKLPSKAPMIPNVTGKSNLGGKSAMPTGKTASAPPLPPLPKSTTSKPGAPPLPPLPKKK